MNGQNSPSSALACGLPRRELRRLLLALAASCLLHAAVIFMPYLGSRSTPTYAAMQTQLTSQRTIVVKLVAAEPSPIATAPPDNRIEAESPRTEAATKDTPVAEHAKGADLLPFLAPAYYETDQLTKRPQPEFLAELETPETKIVVASGKMILRLLIDDQGAIAEVTVEKSDLPEIFSRTAIAAFKQSRFIPGELNGLRVGSVMHIEVSYDDSRTLDEGSAR